MARLCADSVRPVKAEACPLTNQSAVLADLSSEAKILCVGAGTGAEIFHLAAKFAGWHFTAVEPSGKMLEVLQYRAEDAGIAHRCTFHCDYLTSLSASEDFDAATAFLVSQFITDRNERIAFFREIANRLRSGGLLISSDLTGDLSDPVSQDLLEVWFQVLREGGLPTEKVANIREAYQNDLAITSVKNVEQVIAAGGFKSVIPFLQLGMIHAWYSGC